MSKALEQWLRRLEAMRPDRIELGLERVAAVWHRLRDGRRPPAVITVGGTNGKGSVVAFLDALCAATGKRRGTYTSPHLLSFGERIRIDGAVAEDRDLVVALEAVELARQGRRLSYFEFTTLAALELFLRADLELWVLEVGLGGRLDAVNIVSGEPVVITNVGLDHQEWLGPDRESIAQEKAGILRRNGTLIYGESELPSSLAARADTLGVDVRRWRREFDFVAGPGNHRYFSATGLERRVPVPALGLEGAHQWANAACALAALSCMEHGLPASDARIAEALAGTGLAGRMQIVPGSPPLWLDVAHNVAAATVLRRALQAQPCAGRTLAVFGALAGKDIAGIVAELEPVIDAWYLVPTPGERGMSAVELATAVAVGGPDRALQSVAAGLRSARAAARSRDRIVVFGSFRVVAAALAETGNCEHG